MSFGFKQWLVGGEVLGDDSNNDWGGDYTFASARIYTY